MSNFNDGYRMGDLERQALAQANSDLRSQLLARTREIRDLRSMLGWWEALGGALMYEAITDDDLADRLRDNPFIAGALSSLKAERRTQ